MKFEQVDKGNVILAGSKNGLAPLPEVGKVYPTYDDGKIKVSRLEFFRVTRIVPIEDVPENILEVIANEIKETYWLYSSEQSEVVFAKPTFDLCYSDDELFEKTFIRCKDGRWFTAGSLFIGGLLDVDNSLTKGLFNNYNKKDWKKILKDYTNEAYELVCDICNR